MEIFKAPILEKTQLFSKISAFRPKSSFTSRHQKTPSRSKRANANFLLKYQFCISSPFSNGRKLQISAHFGRPLKRRNSLRKKLTDEQKVRQNPEPLDSGSNFQYSNYISDDIESLESNLNSGVSDGDVMEFSNVEKSKSLGDSVLLNKLESWIDQYKKDAEFWGIGSGPVFTVFQDPDGNVERVSVNEDEILRRSRVEPWSFRRDESEEDFGEANLKISHANCLAREIETGEYKLPKNSSIAKFVISGKKSNLISGLRSVTLQPGLFSKLSRIGFVVVCGSFVFWMMKRLLTVRNDEVELTKEEKEMLRRKMKSRMERETMQRGSVEILPDAQEPLMVSTERPRLDKKELMFTILEAKGLEDKLTLQNSSSTLIAGHRDLDDKIQEIREMARHARELERQDPSLLDKIGEENENVNEELSNDVEDIKMHGEVGVSFLNNLLDGDSGKPMGINGTIKPVSLDDPKTEDTGFFGEISSAENSNSLPPSTSNKTIKLASLEDPKTEDAGFFDEISSTKNSDSPTPIGTSSMTISDDGKNTAWDSKDSESTTHLSREVIQSCDTPYDHSYFLNKTSTGIKPRVIQSVEEAREYLSRKRDRREPGQEPQVKTLQEGAESVHVLNLGIDQELDGKTSQKMYKEEKVLESSMVVETLDPKPVTNACEDSTLKKTGLDCDVSQSIPIKTDDPEDAEGEYGADDLRMPRTSQDFSGSDCSTEAGPPINKERWIEKNFQEFEPVVNKIGVGFRENYMVAKQKVQEELSLSSVITQLGSDEDDSELEWMKDDGLREIVFKVRENELAGRDPFHLMDAEDKHAFFKDGISLYDPPEKIIPRWKGPPVDKDPEFLNNFVKQREAFVAGNTGISYHVNKDVQDDLKKSEKSPPHDDTSTYSAVLRPRKISQDGASTNPKTVIEGSDGSIKAGKKYGKEYWQHTKKWSHEFLESYNAETDPEVKSIMKDIGKDLDRWITEKEIQDAADMMTRIPKRKQRVAEKKLEKLKREMEMFGPQAVVSKYREYAEEKQNDYLWWLDLPFVLCIELYTNEDGVQKIGFYSLEMAADLELDPKPYHVVAFEDPGDSKNFCYIVQAHMDMLGNGRAFVVARPPKDAFREAKANGFNVTVIRKGELQLNVDQTLEEVEEQISEIGSKMYHDQIMQERSVDMGSLMKGVFGSSKPTKGFGSSKPTKG
ncbi:hypothetical protein HHK36_000066 [Tetracentron sinense]|uniref:Uncharacterized protein n=1 Tax=Tetracentron sinense TaxID=13715 RepID=A0A835DQH5_TETSI|nr:hypothetical protein HHK36_000066 [Tetracentron sinense]